MKPLIICWIAVLTPAAWGAPTIAVTSPAPSQPLHNVTPLLTVTYSATSPGLDLATLQVLVNGADWTTRFTKTAASASYQVTAADAFTAGTLTLSASIRDTAGTLATITKTYAVHPTLLGLEPAQGAPGVTLGLTGQGLDAVASNSALLFQAQLGGELLRAPLVSVDPHAGTGVAVVPLGARDGEVHLEVNGRVSAQALPFDVRGEYANCGGIIEARFAADGLVVLYDFYWRVQGSPTETWGDPECPLVFGGAGSKFNNPRRTLVKLRPDRSVEVIEDTYRTSSGQGPIIAGFAVAKDGETLAYVLTDDIVNWTVKLRVPGGTVLSSFGPIGLVARNWLIGMPVLAMDFDARGHLYVGGHIYGIEPAPNPYIVYKLSRSALAPGSHIPLTVQRRFEDVERGSNLCVRSEGRSFRIDCHDNLALVLDRIRTEEYCGDRTRVILRRTMLSEGASSSDVILEDDGPNTLTLGFEPVGTCRSDEFVLTYQVAGSTELWRFSGGEATVLASWSGPLPSENPRQHMDVTVNGGVVLDASTLIGTELFTIPDVVVPCGSGPNATARAWPCRKLSLLPTSTRWRPQRATQATEIHFASPVELSAATLEVRGPTGAFLAATTGPLESLGGLNYKLDWTGPWLQADGVTPLLTGHYRVSVRGVRADGAGAIWSDEGVVSVIEVSEVRLEGLPGAPPLSANPAVPALVSQGQDPALGRPGGGKRVFAESTAPGGMVHNRVKVVAVISPALPPSPDLPPELARVRVHLRSFDVDDPAPALPDLDGDTTVDAVADNRGMPGAGALGSMALDIPAGLATAETELTVSLQPGDNYRVAASTSAEWLSGVRARQRVAPDAPVQDGALSVDGSNVSEMLTVWRTLHLEIDSMMPPPSDGSPPEEYVERNFIKGHVLRISVGGPTLDGAETPDEVIPRYVFVEPEATEPALGLADGSNMLPEHGGRFEKGKLTIGDGPQAVIVSPLDGNGVDPATGWEYVRAITTPPEPARIHIPVEVRQGTLREVRTRALAWEHATSTFTLDAPVWSAYVGGTLTAAGLEWTVAAVQGNDVTIVQDGQVLDFRLVDDDPVQAHFPISTAYVSDSDDPAQNVFALAYVRPKRDLVGSVTPPFIRNVWGGLPPLPGDALKRKAQLAAGREWPSTPGFWRSYIQGAAQYDDTTDSDPDNESSGLALTQDLTDQHGSFVFVTALGDHLHCPRSDIMEHTVAHELGHQFGLDHDSGGLMGVTEPPACPLVPRWFTALQLGTIRLKGVQP